MSLDSKCCLLFQIQKLTGIARCWTADTVNTPIIWLAPDIGLKQGFIPCRGPAVGAGLPGQRDDAADVLRVDRRRRRRLHVPL